MSGLQENLKRYLKKFSKPSVGQVSLQAVPSIELGLKRTELVSQVTQQVNKGSMMLFKKIILSLFWIAHLQKLKF